MTNNKENLPKTLTGRMAIGRNGIGYVRSKDFETSIEVPSHETNTALNGDTVIVEITSSAESTTGRVTEIVTRTKRGYAGTLVLKGEHMFLKPMDFRDPEILVPNENLGAGKEGDGVFVTITAWKDNSPIGSVDRVLGDAGDRNAEMIGLVLEKGFDDKFPDEVESESDEIHKRGMPESEYKNRRDMRDILTFTIDPADAKDFDDALSYQKLPNGNLEIGIHIADVSYFVRPGTAMDQEAQDRATSVYLVDRTIPMLPEAISNDLCSLRPNEDKFTYSAIFEINPETGDIINEWFGHAVIHSDKRFTYEEAQDILDDGHGLYYDELADVNRLGKVYTVNRMKEGALDMDQDEVKFLLDAEGKPVKVNVKHRIDTNRLVEEFMLLANRRVAKFMSTQQKHGTFVYRVHPDPAPDRTENLKIFLKALGYDIKTKDGVIPSSEINSLLREVDDSDTKNAIQTAVIRSMSKAIYSTENIGHYGLAFKFYTHFTSPIRRYPDIMVHRLLDLCLSGQVVAPDDINTYKQLAEHSSSREKDAQQAEWASIKFKQVEYMSERVGQTFDGVVTGMTGKGIFVAERETRSEGMIMLRDLPGDFYEYDEKKLVVVGKKNKTNI
ncbi:MAG: ribonuclease R [Candidatus Nomurabacteria bacterium]|nr:ribonuclease R [Candidatus Nomurabacteria bacterium]